MRKDNSMPAFLNELKQGYSDIYKRLIYQDIYEMFDDPRSAGYHNVEKAGLPHLTPISLNLEDFPLRKDEIFAQLNSERYYVNLSPKKESGLSNIYRKPGLTKSEVTSFITENIAPKNFHNYMMLIIEHYQHYIGGSIIVMKGGESFLVEMIPNEQGLLAAGEESPQMFVARDPYTGCFRYSFDDTALRSTVYNTMLCLLTSGSGREMKFQEGYFEFYLTRKTQNEPLASIFFDARNKAPYINIPDPWDSSLIVSSLNHSSN